MSDNKVWVVTYQDRYDDIVHDAIITCFDNEESARKCYNYFLGKHDYVDIDECNIYTNFKVFNTENT